MTDAPSRPRKKSEMLEVRLDFETKQEFLAACRNSGRTASDVVREQIAAFLAEQAQPAAPEPVAATGRVLDFVPAPLRRHRWAAAGIGAVGLVMAAALPSAAAPGPKAAFDKLDANHDGVLSADEFEGKTKAPGCTTPDGEGK